MLAFQHQHSKRNYLISPIGLVVLSGCGGEDGSASDGNYPSAQSYSLTNDVLIDSMTHGSKWIFSEGVTYGYAVAGSPSGLQFSDPEKIADVYIDAVSFFTDIVPASLNFSGYFLDPSSAYSSGVEFIITMDGSSDGQSFQDSPNAYAMAGFPVQSWDRPYTTSAGDIILNNDSDLVFHYNQSTEAGSIFNFVIIHELGHVLGLKHPHDDGGSGRPVFGDYGGLSKSLDNDFYTVMTYNVSHNSDSSATEYDPSTFMVLDVLTLQYLYGKNYSVNSGDTIHKIEDINSFRSIWDPSGDNTVDISNSINDWYVVLPYYVWSDLADEPTGYAVCYQNPYSLLPSDLVWLIGDFDNVMCGDGDDFLIGNKNNNVLYGGSGSDFIEGWEGDDTLYGGGGRDVFYFAVGWGVDTIKDFNPLEDRIVLLDEFLELMSFDDINIRISDENTTFELRQDSQLIVENFNYFQDQNILSEDGLASSDENEKNTKDVSSQVNSSVETESNNTFATADTIEMGTAIFGQISSTSDVYFYMFSIAAASTLRVAFDAPTNSDYSKYFIASVFDSSGVFLSSHQFGADHTFSTALDGDGTYYIQIEDSTFHSDEQYSLVTTLLDGTSGFETEDNGSVAVADTLASGTSVSGQLHWTTDQDFYRVSTDGAATISITFDTPTNSLYSDYFKISLQDSSGTILSSQETGKDISFDTGVTVADDYYIVVESSTFHTTDEYLVSNNVIV